MPETWFTAQIDLAKSGVDVIVGTVRPDSNDLTPEQVDAFEQGALSQPRLWVT